MSCEKQPNRKALGRSNDKASLSNDAILPGQKGSRLAITSTCSESHMIPYVFATGHHSYARYGLYYFRSSEAMLDEICRQFLQGEHVTRHLAGAWYGMWTDIGITLKPNAVNTWALSLHICCRIRKDIR